MKIVLLCKYHNHRKVIEILEAFRGQGLQVCGLVALDAPHSRLTFTELVRKAYHRGVWPFPKTKNVFAKSRLESSLHVIGRNGKAPQRAEQAVQTLAEYARQRSIPIVRVRDLNGDACAAALQKFSVDLLILGGTPIIRASVLAVPRLGTLNVHMAALPEFRGMNVAEWSIYHDAPATVTVHFVDAGVDTGAVLYHEEIDVSDCHSIAEMRRKVSRQQHYVLAKAARKFAENQSRPAPQDAAGGKQYYLMHAKLRHVVEQKLRRGYHSRNSQPGQAAIKKIT